MATSVGKTLLDSGAHTLYTEEVLKKGKQLAFGNDSRLQEFSYYETDAFWEYVDKYGQFCKEYGEGLDGYVTVDVIFNPELSWKSQRYLEDNYGVKPMPVFHWGTDLRWLKRYLKEGHQVIGLGGLGQEVHLSRYVDWADRVFTYVGQAQSPIHTHGFAMTAMLLIARYPWGSVDSTTWTLLAGYGKVLVPHVRRGKFDFDHPYIVSVSNRKYDKAPKREAEDWEGALIDARPRLNLVPKAGHHKKKKEFTYSKMRGEERRCVDKWFEYIGSIMGDDNELGLCNSHTLRCVANLHFFLHLERWLSEKDRTVQPRQGFSLV